MWWGGSGREREEGRLGQVNVLAAARGPAWAPALGGGGWRPGWGGEAERGHEQEALGVGAPAPAAGAGPHPRAPTPHSAPPRLPQSPSGIWGVSPLLKKNFVPASAARETRAGLSQRVLCCALPPQRNIGDFFFFCIIHFLPSPPRPSPAPLLLPRFRLVARTLLTPEFSLQVPRPGATLASKSLTFLLPHGGTVFPSPGASRAAASCVSAQLREETLGLRAFLFFILFFFREAQVLWRLLLGSRILRPSGTYQLPLKNFLPKPRARTPSAAAEAPGEEGAAGAPPATGRRPSPPARGRSPRDLGRPGAGSAAGNGAAGELVGNPALGTVRLRTGLGAREKRIVADL